MALYSLVYCASLTAGPRVQSTAASLQVTCCPQLMDHKCTIVCQLKSEGRAAGMCTERTPRVVDDIIAGSKCIGDTSAMLCQVCEKVWVIDEC